MTLGLAALSAWGMGEFQLLTSGLEFPLPSAGESNAAYQLRIDGYNADVGDASFEIFTAFFRVGGGLSLAAISPELRRRFDLEESVVGVVVTEIADDSIAARKGLRLGDVIVEVGQEEVSAPGDVARKVAKAKEEGRKSVLLLLDRKGDLRFVALRVDKS